MQNQFRYLARFTIETNTPLSIGSGRGGLLNQRLIAKDANGLPYIPGTALAGVVRHELAKQAVNQAAIEKLFGYQHLLAKDGQGSRIDFSSAHLLAEDGQTVLEGLCEIDFSQAYYQNFKRLPERDHVRIDHRGVAVKHNKFEEELVHRGTRFVFELELQGTAADKTHWQIILGILNAPMFRVGAGTRKGFGQFKVIDCTHREYDLSQKEALLAYLGKSSSLNQALQGWSLYQAQTIKNTWTTYSITLKARDFFLYSAGTGNKHADVTPKKEKIFVWPEQGSPQLEERYLLPATSIKGALA
ncbi:RAMP superfamily CRISPR-associated protein, partial [Haliscomenobacter sp.]|uniref:RAMP superfamily CRISPR-associated protein n=1 Tax=Haliscomenobacter sp. TaxID=2717303 RepID=UPI00359417FE